MNKEVKETIKILQNNSLVKSGSYEFIGDSDITYAEIYILLKFIEDLYQENQKYKEVIFKIKMIISARIKEYQKKIDNEIDMGSQGDHFKICRYEENIKFLKDILKEVE